MTATEHAANTARAFLAAEIAMAAVNRGAANVTNATELPRPSRSLEVALSVGTPDGTSLLVKSVEFKLAAGEVLGIVGPSGSGKTSLARALIGVWPTVRGTVRLDSATLDQWGSEARGRHIGYVAQTSELFDGTIAENIARMRATWDS